MATHVPNVWFGSTPARLLTGMAARVPPVVTVVSVFLG